MRRGSSDPGPTFFSRLSSGGTVDRGIDEVGIRLDRQGEVVLENRLARIDRRWRYSGRDSRIEHLSGGTERTLLAPNSSFLMEEPLHFEAPRGRGDRSYRRISAT